MIQVPRVQNSGGESTNLFSTTVRTTHALQIRFHLLHGAGKHCISRLYQEVASSPPSDRCSRDPPPPAVVPPLDGDGPGGVEVVVDHGRGRGLGEGEAALVVVVVVVATEAADVAADGMALVTEGLVMKKKGE